MLSVGIDIALVRIGHGRVDDGGMGLLNKDDIHWKRGQVLGYVIQSRSPSGVVRPQVRSPDSRTNSLMKLKVAFSERAEPVELHETGFQTATRQYSYVSDGGRDVNGPRFRVSRTHLA
jgi:hypothetical protein